MPEQPPAKIHQHPWMSPGREQARSETDAKTKCVELSCMSNFSFLEGASHPEEFVVRAAQLGYDAIGIADRNTLAGAVRAFVAARDHGVRLVLGARVEFEIDAACRAEIDAASCRIEILLFPTDLASYGRLCRLLSRGRAIGAATLRRDADSAGGLFRLPLHTLLERDPHGRALHEGLLGIVIAPRGFACMEQWFLDALAGAGRIFDADRLSLAVWRLGEADGELRVRQMQWLSHAHGVPLVAINDPHMHVAERRPLQDVLTCVRHGCTIDAAGRRLFPNAERHLRAPEVMEALFADLERELQSSANGRLGPIARSRQIADRCAGFSLDQIRYQYPSEVVPGGTSAIEELRRLVHAGVVERYPAGAAPDVLARLEHELALIDELDCAPYFLTVHDIVRFARSRDILCQGRGAAANSAVCFVLGVTAVDPARIDMLFERFMSRERNEPPDIDIDFEHERREEVIQYIYAKYGRDRAAIAAEVISYRGRSAIRDVGKALGFGLDTVDSLASGIDWWHRDLGDAGRDEQLTQRGLDPRDPRLCRLFALAGELLGFPRHLSQHVGGFIITEGALCELVPIRAAGMPDRTIIEWDKDDLDAMGLMKVDVLALGMLTAIRKALDLVNHAVARGIESDRSWRGQSCAADAHDGAPPPPRPLRFHEIPAEDPRVYEMICRADTVGVFQIESRAQMSMLPRLRPKCFYDLVIEVAIVRPGPIVGNMVHPYLRRRSGEEPIVYPNETIRRVLGKTLGVPLFQEQAMSLAIVAAGFTPGEADALRRAIAAWKRMGSAIAAFGEKLIGGMLARGYERVFAEQVFRQIQGFSGYGFPESHAASFALLVYVSSWLKCHHPAAFTAALLNSQPMGFYAPAQLVADAKAHEVEVRAIDVNASAWDCTLEAAETAEKATAEKAAAEKVTGTFCGKRCLSPFPRSPFPPVPPALRLGLRLVAGLAREDADRIVTTVRAHGAFRSIEGLWRQSGVGVGALRRLARADAFRSMGLPRQQALWQIRRLRDEPAPLFAQPSIRIMESDEAAPLRTTRLPPIAAPVEVSMDYEAAGLSLKGHPMEFLRRRLLEARASTCGRVRSAAELPSGSFARCAGLVLVRQRPSTAKGVLFMTIEDETGTANLILKPKIYERHRRAARHAAVILVEGKVERRNEVCHMLVRRLRSIDQWLATAEATIPSHSRDFH